MNNKETFDFRDKIFSELYQVFKKDKNCILLTNDMGAIGLDILKRKFKKRVINCGISEQNIISLAGGLASEKRHVFIYGIISQLIFRGLEQIKIDLCLDALPVTIIGVGAGLVVVWPQTQPSARGGHVHQLCRCDAGVWA